MSTPPTSILPAQLALPTLAHILRLKAERAAVVVAHNYQTPLIANGIADFVGDSLAMARFAGRCEAPLIVVCGVRSMAATVKLLCPEKTVLRPAPRAGWSLAESVTAEDILALRRRHPDTPVVAYVNTSAAVKAEADICCTSANAVAVAGSLGGAAIFRAATTCVTAAALCAHRSRSIPDPL